MKGLPCTRKSEIAKAIGAWARCPVLYIDDFLYTLSKDRGYDYAASSLPSPDEAEHLYRVGFDGLCKAATRHLKFGSSCVVIKSRLNSTSELDRLEEMAREIRYPARIIIIECQMKNEHRFRLRLESKAKEYGDEEDWYRPRKSWKDIEKAREECDNVDARAHLDRHLLHLLDNGGFIKWMDHPSYVIRLVLDPFDNLHLIPADELMELTSSFQHAIRYLLQADREDLDEDPSLRSGLGRRYMVAQFSDVRRYLVEKELRRQARNERSSYLCAKDTGSEAKCCIFKYLPEGIISPTDDSDCGVCGKRVHGSISGGQPAAYSCYFCFLTLHKSCAELNGVHSLLGTCLDVRKLTETSWHACKSCKEVGRTFFEDCKACEYETYLKDRLFPTVIHHDSHLEHFLTLDISDTTKMCVGCNVCVGGTSYMRPNGSHSYRCYSFGPYRCYICGCFYCVGCLLLLRELEHTHGGHEHVLRLMYSHDQDGGDEESYRCEVCYEDMDPQLWFYSCQECPFTAHPGCCTRIFP